MALRKKREPSRLTPTVEKIAHLIKLFDTQQKAKLLRLVPELQWIQPETAEIPNDQAELLAHFYNKIDVLPEARPMQDDDVFLDGLTVAEFFALPESEQDRLWHEAHVASERQLKHQEQMRELDALLTR